MKAIVYTQYGPPEVLQQQEVAKPSPKPNEVLIRVRATSVSAGDCRARSFNVPRAVWLPARLVLGLFRPRQPILGLELAGEVEAVGALVRRFQPGDAVFAATLRGFGAYAEYRCLPEQGAIARIPVGLSMEAAATVPIGARTALHYLRYARLQPGQTVLIYGASGSVGSYAVQIARQMGAAVTAVCSQRNLETVKGLGAQRVIDYTRTDLSAEAGGYDVVLVAIDKIPFAHCLRLLKPGGCYLNVTTPLPSLAMLWARLRKGIRLKLGENAPESATDLQHLAELIAAGQLSPLIDRHYSLEQIVEAHRYVDQGHKRGNVAITVQGAA